MSQRHKVEAVDSRLKYLMKCNLPFGGKVLLSSGDFKKIRPVLTCCSRAQVVNSCFKSSPLFPLFKIIQLNDTMRPMAIINDTNADENVLQFPLYILMVAENKFSDVVDSIIKLPTSARIDSYRSNMYNIVFKDIHFHYTDVAQQYYRLETPVIIATVHESTLIIASKYKEKLNHKYN